VGNGAVGASCTRLDTQVGTLPCPSLSLCTHTQTLPFFFFFFGRKKKENKRFSPSPAATIRTYIDKHPKKDEKLVGGWTDGLLYFLDEYYMGPSIFFTTTSRSSTLFFPFFFK
jgi:hypothetical protein